MVRIGSDGAVDVVVIVEIETVGIGGEIWVGIGRRVEVRRENLRRNCKFHGCPFLVGQLRLSANDGAMFSRGGFGRGRGNPAPLS